MSPDNYDEISSHQHLSEIFIVDSAFFRVLIDWSRESIKKNKWLLILNTISHQGPTQEKYSLNLESYEVLKD